MTVTELRRGDVVLVAFPFVAAGRTERKRRPALVVQADRYNRRRHAVIIAQITSARTGVALPCKVAVAQSSAAGRRAGLRLDSVIDCQTIATVPSEEIVAQLGTLTPELMVQVDKALTDALGLQR
ncbi:MAG: type II toxin-antitoxin system PemK/MazF family toxin [Gemmatimonadales bacterium]|jgi:mRNA interferase MazF